VTKVKLLQEKISRTSCKKFLTLRRALGAEQVWYLQSDLIYVNHNIYRAHLSVHLLNLVSHRGSVIKISAARESRSQVGNLSGF